MPSGDFGVLCRLGLALSWLESDRRTVFLSLSVIGRMLLKSTKTDPDKYSLLIHECRVKRKPWESSKIDSQLRELREIGEERLPVVSLALHLFQVRGRPSDPAAFPQNNE